MIPDMILLSNVEWLIIPSRLQITIDLLCNVAFDIAVVANAASSINYDPPDPALRERARSETAATLGELILPDQPAARRRAIEKVVEPLVDCAISSIEIATVAGLLSERALSRANETIDRTGRDDGAALGHANSLRRQGVDTLLTAHADTERALGAWEAVSAALRSD